MQMKYIHLAAALLAGMCSVLSCVKIDDELGKEYIPTRHQYDIHIDTVYLQDIRMDCTDSLSGYSSERITIGAVRDNVFGLTTRGSAFPLIPVSKDMDFGENPRCTQFHFSAIRDTLSWPDENQANIIQNVNVYRLNKAIDEKAGYLGRGDKLDIGGRVAPVFNYFGQDSLAFNFDPGFGDEYIAAIREMELDSVSDYVKKLPGIYITIDAPVSEGGRINMFELPISVTESYYIGGNYAELKFRADYGSRKDVDSSFLFFFGAQAMQVYQDTENEYIEPEQTEQYALNVSSTEGLISGIGTDKLYIEGGNGVKPVLSSREIKESLTEIFSEKGIDPSKVIIHKATAILPYDFQTESYDKMYLYPDRLSPTCKLSLKDEETGDDYVTFAGLTDSSVESENQGDINRSTCCYSPDISHHVQEILRRTDESNYSNYDIWMLTMANETVEEESDNSSSALSQYYQNLAYYDYYNSMYNPYGYGGYYGGYYGYGYNSYYGMSNYYNYILAAQYASQASSSGTTVSVQLDKDRYYRGVLCGPDSEGRVPMMVVTYSVSKTSGM